MSEPTCPQLVTSRDAASLIFNLPGYDVIDAVDLPCGGRRVVVQALDQDEGCPDCGVVSTPACVDPAAGQGPSRRWHRARGDRRCDRPQAALGVRRAGVTGGRSSRSPTSSRSGPGV